jgi:hypothetical protein
MDHEWLLRMLKERIDDAAFLNGSSGLKKQFDAI